VSQPFSLSALRVVGPTGITSGLVLFTVASLFCACAVGRCPAADARVLQGTRCRGINDVNTALVFAPFNPGRCRLGFRRNAMVVADRLHAGPDIAPLHPSDWTLTWSGLPSTFHSALLRSDRA